MLELIIFTIKVFYSYLIGDFSEVPSDTQEVQQDSVNQILVSEEEEESFKFKKELPKHNIKESTVFYTPLEDGFNIDNYVSLEDEISSSCSDTKLTYAELFKKLEIDGMLNESNPNYKDYLEYLDYLKKLEEDQDTSKNLISKENLKKVQLEHIKPVGFKTATDKFIFLQTVEYKSNRAALQEMYMPQIENHTNNSHFDFEENRVSFTSFDTRITTK